MGKLTEGIKELNSLLAAVASLATIGYGAYSVITSDKPVETMKNIVSTNASSSIQLDKKETVVEKAKVVDDKKVENKKEITKPELENSKENKTDKTETVAKSDTKVVEKEQSVNTASNGEKENISVAEKSFASPRKEKSESPMPKSIAELGDFADESWKLCDEYFKDYYETIALPVYEGRITDYEAAMKANQVYMKVFEKHYRYNEKLYDYLHDQIGMEFGKHPLFNKVGSLPQVSATLYSATKSMDDAFKYKLHEGNDGRYKYYAQNALTSMSSVDSFLRKHFNRQERAFAENYPTIKAN